MLEKYPIVFLIDSNAFSINVPVLDCEDFDCDLSGWITKNITVCAGMFEGCKNFKHDLSNWKIHSTVYNRRNMFKNCKLPKKYMPEFIKL